MEINKTNILLVIIAILAAYSIFQGNGIRTEVARYNDKIKSIQTEIDSVRIANESLNQEILKLDDKIDNIDGDIENVSKNITVIKKQTNEKIDAVNEYTFSDLNKFFSNRYSGYNSIPESTNR